MTTTTCAEARTLLVLCLTLAIASGALAAEDEFDLGGYRYPASPATEWLLPDVLREVSGFATDEQGRLFAHNDESAVVHEIDPEQGRIIRSFGLGDPPIAGDFEGITFIDGRVALTDSDGVLYLAAGDHDGTRVPFERIATGIGARCEVEGIAYEQSDGILYFACKTARTPVFTDRIVVIAWSPARRAEIAGKTLTIDVERFGALPGKGKLRPSDIAIAPASGDLVLTTAKRRALLTIARDGTQVSALRLPDAKDMKQIEAIAFGADGALLLGSEGKERGRMRVYRPAS